MGVHEVVPGGGCTMGRSGCGLTTSGNGDSGSHKGCRERREAKMVCALGVVVGAMTLQLQPSETPGVVDDRWGLTSPRHREERDDGGEWVVKLRPTPIIFHFLCFALYE